MREILIDDREKNEEIRSFFQSDVNVSLQITRLSVGDYLLHNLVVERKSLTDFCGSIKSGRLFSQATQLARANIQPLIIIEILSGELKRCNLRLEAIQGAIITLSILFGIPVLRSRSPKETARLMLFASHQIDKFGTGNKCLRRPPPPTIFKTDKFKMQMHILPGFPGIGPFRAKKLLDCFGTVKRIFEANEEELIGLTGFDKKIIMQMLEITN